MPGILNKSTSNSTKFKTVLGISNPLSDTDDNDQMEDPEPAGTIRNTINNNHNPANSKGSHKGRKLKARPPVERTLYNRQSEDNIHAENPIAGSAHRIVRPLRMDTPDGLWSVSVAEASTKSFTIYIKTPTHHLTLTRSANEITELHDKIRDQVPSNAPLPTCPLNHEPPQKRKSSFLTTLSRLASPPPRNIPTPQQTTPQDFSDPFLSAEQSATSALASYLTTLANDPHVRVARSWKRFVRVRTDDLESVRVERAIKRVRSDIATHTSTTVALPSTTTPTAARATTTNGTEASEANTTIKPTFERAPSSSGFVGQDIEEEDEGSEMQHQTTILGHGDVELPKEESKEVEAATEQGNTTELPSPESASINDDDSKPIEEHPAHIPRSVSADPDKATRFSRMWRDSPSLPAQSETDATDADDTDAFDRVGMSDAGMVYPEGKKKKKLSKKSRKVVIDDFEMMRVLGKGCAGKVLLVKHKRSNALYALKAITKRHVLAHQELQHTMTEQAVLKRMARDNSDPFVVKLYWSFHDKENLFLVMDFHPGGDLATQLARWGRLGRDRARFYAAEITEGVEGLHAAGVIYRDLKPENILIGGDGHIVLTDFGLSKEFPRRGLAPTNLNVIGGEFYASSPATPTGENHGGMPYWMDPEAAAQKEMWLTTKGNDTTTTFCGTAEYLAPEVIQGLPYSYEVDWWSFGTMLYEMLTGITPFWANNHSDMYVRVLQDELTFPEDKAMDQDTKSLIRGLLQRNPALRLGEPRIKKHPYFSMIDWQHVYHKRYIPPYVPPIDPSNASDTQNFDDAFLDMEPVLDTDVENDEQTGSERDKSTTGADTPVNDEDSSKVESTIDSTSPSETPISQDDVFDGYSFKARNSLLIEDDGYEGTDESEEDEPPVKQPIVEDTIVEPEEEELDAGQKTPEAHPPLVVVPVTPASAVVEAFRKQELEEEDRLAEDAAAAAILAEDDGPLDEILATVAKKATPEKVLPIPPADKQPTAAKDPKKTTFEKTKPRSKILDQLTRKSRPRRERSGVAALDRDLSDVLDEDEGATEREDDDWDFVEAPGGEEMNGAQGKSLFARGVVDRYRLKVFGKYSGTVSSRSASRTISEAPVNPLPIDADFGEVTGSPSPSEKRRGRGGLSLRKPKTFLRPKSPPSTFSAASTRSGLSHSHSATISGSSNVLLTPSASTPLSLPSNGKASLKTQPSMNSVGSPGSSDTSTNGEQLARLSLTQSAAELSSPLKAAANRSSPDLSRRQPRESEGEDGRAKPLKKMRKYTEQGAEKVMSLFSSPQNKGQSPAR